MANPIAYFVRLWVRRGGGFWLIDIVTAFIAKSSKLHHKIRRGVMEMVAQPSVDDFWVFGYGSLIWRPGFSHIERRMAQIFGYHRALCIYSHVHRGTPETPGLVLGLDAGGTCHGVAYRVAGSAREEVMAYLRAREQATMVYRETQVPAHLANGGVVSAVTYVAERDHAQYAGRLSLDKLLALVRQGCGISGENPEYILNTYAHLEELGIHDETLAWLAKRLGPDYIEPAL